MQAKEVKIELNDSMKEVIRIYNVYFGQPGTSNMVGSMVERPLPLEGGFINWIKGETPKITIQGLDYAQEQGKLNNEVIELNKESYQLIQTQLLNYDTQKKSLFWPLFEGFSHYDPELIFDHRYLVTALIMHKLNRIAQMTEAEKRIEQLTRLHEFVTAILANQSLLKTSSNEFTTKSLRLTLNGIDIEIGEIIDEQKSLLKSEALAQNLKTLSVKNTINTINHYLLRIFILNKSITDQNPLVSLHEETQEILATITFKEFKRRSDSSNSTNKDYIPIDSSVRSLLQHEENFVFIQQFFLKPVKIGKLLSQYHQSTADFERTSLLTEIKELTRKVEPSDFVNYGLFGELTKDKEGTNKEKFNALSETEQLALRQVANLINLKNEAYILNFYVEELKTLVIHAGNLSKFFARDELDFLLQKMRKLFNSLGNSLEVFDRNIQRVMLYRAVAIAKEDSSNLYQNFYNRNADPLKTHLNNVEICLENISAAIQHTSMQEDLQEMKDKMIILTEGLVNVLGMSLSSQELSEKLVRREEHLNKLKDLNQKDMELTESYVMVEHKETELTELQAKNKLLELKNQEQAELIKTHPERTQSALALNDKIVVDLASLNLANKEIVQQLKDKIIEISTAPELTKQYEDATKQINNMLLNFHNCINKLDAYNKQYRTHTERVNQRSCGFFHLHHHGVDGVIRAENNQQKWLTKDKAQLLEHFYFGVHGILTNNEGKAPPPEEIKTIYLDSLKALKGRIKENITSLKSGNRHRHSYKTYLLAYKIDIEKHIKDIEAADKFDTVRIDKQDTSSYGAQLENKEATPDVKTVYKAHHL